MLKLKRIEAVLVVALICTSSAAVILAYSSSGSTVTTSCAGPCSTITTTSTTTVTLFSTSTRFFTSPATTITNTATVTSTTTTTATTNTCCNLTSERLGFWLQEQDIMENYPPSTFFTAMFMTPPYPASMEVMIFGIRQAETNSQGCNTGNGYVANSINYWSSLASLADAYPKIQLIFEIAFDGSSGGAGAYGLSCFNTVATALAAFSSVYGIGIEGEYTTPQTSGLYTSAYNDIHALGKQFVNYYASPGVIPVGGYDITHTNFPGGDTGGYDQVGTLMDYDSQTIGLDSGYYVNLQFPGTVTCPIGPSAMNSGTAGWNQCVVNTEIATASSFRPASARQFLEIDVGFSSSGSFTGVSGQTTNQLWDNPTLRIWIWTDPNYTGNFVLSP